MKKLLSAFIMLLFFAVTGNEVNLLKNGDFSRYKVNWVTNGKVTEEGKTGVLTLSGKANRAFSRQVIEFGPKTALQMTADISADKPVQVWIGLIPVDKNWKEINYRNTGVIAGTMTETAEAVNKNSDTVILKKAVKIRKGQYLALDAKEDLSDLPNYRLERIKSVASKDGKCVVKLFKSIRRSIPAGCKVRIHTDGPTYFYAATLRKGFPGKVQAKGVIGGTKGPQFRPGTAGVKACLLIVPGKNAKDVKVQFRNVQIVKIAQ